MKRMIKSILLIPILIGLLAVGMHAQNGNGNGGNNTIGQCNHARAVAMNDATVSTLLDNWNTGCFRLDEMQCTPLGEILVLCAEHPCPAPIYLVELTWPIRSYLCGVQVPAPGHIKVHVTLGPGGGSAWVVEAPFF